MGLGHSCNPSPCKHPAKRFSHPLHLVGTWETPQSSRTPARNPHDLTLTRLTCRYTPPLAYLGPNEQESLQWPPEPLSSAREGSKATHLQCTNGETQGLLQTLHLPVHGSTHTRSDVTWDLMASNFCTRNTLEFARLCLKTGKWTAIGPALLPAGLGESPLLSLSPTTTVSPHYYRWRCCCYNLDFTRSKARLGNASYWSTRQMK